jgi:coatomer protein complex subunit epsilon
MGSLFQVYNSFHLGAYQVAINEASDLLDLSPSESVEKDCYVYRSYIALGSHQLVMDEIPDDSPSALQAVKSLATYLANPLDRETQAQKMKDMLEDPAIAQNATVQLMAATIFAKEGEMVEAMRCCSTMLSLELSAFMVNLLISMDRVDAAEKTLAKMVANDDDATLTQLATAWVNVALGGSKVQDAMYVYQELGDKYTWTVKLFNGAATCAMAMGRFEDAEKELLEALQRDSKDPDTLHNLAVCALHLGKPATRFFNQLKTLTPKPGAVEKMEELEKMFDTASEQMASA